MLGKLTVSLEKHYDSPGQGGRSNVQNEKDWSVIKYCLLVVFLSYVIIYTVEAM